jgi:hypothetical protein
MVSLQELFAGELKEGDGGSEEAGRMAGRGGSLSFMPKITTDSFICQ